MSGQEKTTLLGLDLKNDRGNINLQIDLGGKALAVVCGLATLLVATGVVVGLGTARFAQLQRHVDEREAEVRARVDEQARTTTLYVAGESASMQAALRANTIAKDLSTYNAQEVRILQEVNKQLQVALLSGGCTQ